MTSPPSTRIRVLHAVDSLRLGGMERMAVELANLLDPDVFDVAVCATRESGAIADALRQEVPLVVLGRRSRWDVSGMTALARLVRRRRVEIVHSHGRGTAKLVSLCRAAGMLPAAHVFHDHRGDDGGDGADDPGLRLAVRLGVDAYIGVYQGRCQSAVEHLGLPPSKVHLVRNGVDLRRFPADAPLPGTRAEGRRHRPLRLVMVAGFRPVKDHPTLLRAIAACRHRERIELLLVGPPSPADGDYFDRCRSLVDSLGLSAQVKVLGGRSDVPAILAASDAGVLASRSESGPLALLEYMAAGLPFVVTDTGEIVSSIQPATAGFVVPPGAPRAMAEAIDRLVELPPSERRAMGANGRAQVLAQFDQRRSACVVSELYGRLVADRSRARTRRREAAPAGGAPC